jgi:uncharacterized protein YjdB
MKNIKKGFLFILVFVFVSLTFNYSVFAGAKEVSVTAVNLVKPGYSMLTMEKGKTFTIKANVIPDNASNKKLTYASSNKKIVTVTNTGVIKAVGKGKAAVTVSSSDHSNISKKIE